MILSPEVGLSISVIFYSQIRIFGIYNFIMHYLHQECKEARLDGYPSLRGPGTLLPILFRASCQTPL